MVSRIDQARVEMLKRMVRWVFDRIEEMRRQRYFKKESSIKRFGIQGVKYVSTCDSLASPSGQYDEFVNY
jgi:hypothetical protein